MIHCKPVSEPGLVLQTRMLCRYCWNGSVPSGVKVFVSAMAQQLQQWQAALPEALRFDYNNQQPVPLPSPFVLQLQ